MENLNIIHESKDILVVNKPASIITEVSPFEENTLEAQVANHLSQNSSKPFVGVIHRLDRVTSGVLVFAKKKNALKHYNELFSSKQVQKTYLAIVDKKPPKKLGTLVHHLVKNQKEKRAEIYDTKQKDSKPCSLRYEIINENKHGYLLEIKPKTGRFHQIRAQLSSIGCPIIGDEKYDANQTYQNLSICLHAQKIEIDNQTFQASLPANDFWVF